jgi:hypothetical protein
LNNRRRAAALHMQKIAPRRSTPHPRGSDFGSLISTTPTLRKIFLWKILVPHQEKIFCGK